ncbi:hypothetical protein [Mesorhizobium sp. WSM3224]|uniref:hypothetical protein n=1 Tax=Mesorhizobium sp. WSM3224 TaxID=1040986 RepID=UPI000416AB24|nr:hypothetical protein [Mesorhizobium sp. WSM3224]
MDVVTFMADLDTHIAGELSVLQARGADRYAIETRHKELCGWAIDQCVKADTANQPANIEQQQAISSDELATLRHLWVRLLPDITRVVRDGMTVDWVSVVRCEDGISIHMNVEVAEDADIHIYAGADFYRHFEPAKWEDALASIAADYDAPRYVEDLFPQAAMDEAEPAGPWRRMF